MPSLGALLSNYIDLLNSEGPDGPNAQAFIKQHQANDELMELAKSAREVRALFARDYLHLSKKT